MRHNIETAFPWTQITIGRAAGGTLTLNNPTISVPGSVSMTTGGASLSVAGSVSVQGSTTFSGEG